MVLFFPETARKVVGNGSLQPRGPRKTIISLLRRRPLPSVLVKQRSLQRSFYWPNPLACLPVVLDPGSALVMVVGGIFYTVFSCLAASLSTLCIDLYDLNYLQAGLVYLPAGAGGILAAYMTGRLLDRDYKKTAQEHGVEVHRPGGDDVSDFPIEEARLRSVWYPAAVATTSTVGYGWALKTEMHLAIPLVLQLLMGGTMVSLFTVSSPAVRKGHFSR
ncbi:MAG: hypothetical protein LQ346_000469 [Caloplaca aetnensis]|nr:MAG: hypothetical protein LQ346_000469 [Caloplaca aetnensis]